MTTPTLEPVDTKQCQTMKGGAFTLGPGRMRCRNEATYVVREKAPGPDGLCGAMSLCDDCRKVFHKRMDVEQYEFWKVAVWSEREAKESQ